MKHGVIYLSSALLVAFLAVPLIARADANPDFDDDAKPILKMQPGLLQYVESRFDVKETGAAKYPGDDDRPPAPPYIFRARPIGSHGPYYLRLLIQPGSAGHILGVVDMNKAHVNPPGAPAGPDVANQPPPQEPQQPSAAPAQQNPSAQVPELSEPPVTQQPPLNQSQAPQAPAQQPAQQQPTAPTADTPSGPINDSGSSNGQQNLAPPPDPAPPAQ